MRSIDVSLLRAWREYLGLSQNEVASRISVSQSAYSQMEDKDARLRPATVKKIATALGLDVRQLEP